MSQELCGVGQVIGSPEEKATVLPAPVTRTGASAGSQVSPPSTLSSTNTSKNDSTEN